MRRETIVRTEQTARRSAIGWAILAGALMAVGVLTLWYVVDQRAHEHAGSSIDHAVHMNTLLIRQDADNRLLALGRLALRSVTDSHLSQADWDADAKQYLADMPGFETVQWITPALATRWAVGTGVTAEASGNDIATIPAVRAGIKSAQADSSPLFSDIFGIDDPGGPRVAVIAPVFHHGEYEGVIAGVIEPGYWLESVIGELQNNDHHIEILLEGFPIFRFDAPGDTLDARETIRHPFASNGLAWEMRVTPTTSFLSAGHADASSLVLVVGMLLSGLTAAAVYFGFAARDRSHQYHDVALQLATLFRNLPGMAYRRNKDSTAPMAFVSEGCQALSGYPREVFAEGDKDWLDLVHSDDRERVTAIVQSAVSGGEAFEVKYRITDSDGKVRWMWERGRVVQSEANNDVHIEGFVTDITEQRSAEGEAREHREHLAHVDRLNMLGEMATGIAHEINQPLSAISILVQAGDHLIRTGRYEKLAEILEKLVRHAHRASAVIDRMQQMARRRESIKETIDCRELIRDVTRLADAEARMREIEIKTDTQDGLPAVSVDAVQIQQVMLNLLRNGMDAMQSIGCRNGKTIGIRTQLRDDGGVEIAVVDKGDGVSERAADKLFAPFSTTKKSGMGMGLSISRAIVTAHGGNLNFHNNRDAGATFYFTLPPAEQEDNS